MKRIMMLLLLLIPQSAHSAIGCMKNSRKLTEPFDYKNWEFVQCNCPCNRKILSNGLCWFCQHRGTHRLRVWRKDLPDFGIDMSKVLGTIYPTPR